MLLYNSTRVKKQKHPDIKNKITQTNRSNGGVIEGKNQRCQGTGGEGEARANEKRQSLAFLTRPGGSGKVTLAALDAKSGEARCPQEVPKRHIGKM